LTLSMMLPVVLQAQSPPLRSKPSPLQPDHEAHGRCGHHGGRCRHHREPAGRLDEGVWLRRPGAHSTPFTPGTIMNVGSIAKPITGVAMMRAVQEGRLSLDAEISTYLAFKVVNPHHPDAPITLRHLATHTSSITDRWEVYRDTTTAATLPSVSIACSLHFEPGCG
jgi:hypothetical protein